MSRRDRKRRRRVSLGAREDVNPMNYLSNLSDAMLVLAVGIMLALVLHYNLDLTVESASENSSEDSVVTFTDDELEEQTQVPDNATQAGSVYYDSETDTYYIVNE